MYWRLAWPLVQILPLLRGCSLGALHLDHHAVLHIGVDAAVGAGAADVADGAFDLDARLGAGEFLLSAALPYYPYLPHLPLQSE